MTTLVVGASGATGRFVVEQLLSRGEHVRSIVRSPDKLPPSIREHPNSTVIVAGVAGLTEAELARHVDGCRAVVSCLGHNLSFRGVFGPPRRLVTDATRRLCDLIRANRPATPVKFVLMNTAGNRNRDLDEPVSWGEHAVLFWLRRLLPPHADNEQAADYLRAVIGQGDGAVEWVAVRPDGLIDVEKVTPYDVHASPTRSAIFNAGQTSRVNVAHFMAELIADDALWAEWKGRMPVIYNREA